MKRILIVEDDLVVGTVYRRFLQSHGFEIEVVTDGIRALDRLTAFQPDAVVLDLILPQMSGIEVLKAIRAQEPFRELPVIVLTNAWIPAFVDQANNAGATKLLDKSKDTPSVMLGILQSLLGVVPALPGRTI